MSSLIAVLAAILVSMWPIAQYYRMVEDGNKRAVVAVTAGQFSMLLGGIKKYIRAHTNDLINNIPVGSSTTVSLATLTAERDLPSGFTTTNPYNQTWVAYVTQSASGVLDGRVISYGGQTLSPRDAVAIALKAGAQGGYIPPNNLISGLNSGMAVGAGGTWSQSMAGFPNPGAGHLVGLVASADDANNNPNYLYRSAIAGHPELTTMETDLNMGGNNINNANQANVQAIITGTDNGTAVLNAPCSSNGAIASSTDGTGTHLECISGTWTSLGSDTLSTTISGAADEYNSWTLTKTRDPTVPTGVRKRLMGQTRHVIPSGDWYDTHITINFPEPFHAIFPGGYGVSQVTDPSDTGGHDNMPWVKGTPSLTSITVIFNQFTYTNSSGWINWWVEGY